MEIESIKNQDQLLRLRLYTCLQTILELEPDLGNLPVKHTLQEELGSLKEIINEIDSIFFTEEDVLRIEHATSALFKELAVHMPSVTHKNKDTAFGLLQ